jgi:hypothetical protein
MSDAKRAHDARITAITRRFVDGDIGLGTKRQLIHDENVRFYQELGEDVPRHLRGEVDALPDSSAAIEHVLAQATGAPLEQVQAALDAARQGSRASQYAESVREARDLDRIGRQTAQDILFGTAEVQARARQRRDQAAGRDEGLAEAV